MRWCAAIRTSRRAFCSATTRWTGLRDQMFRELLTYMMENSSVVFSAFELVLVAKNLERIGDHATNIAEDVIYFVAGRDVRHPALDRR